MNEILGIAGLVVLFVTFGLTHRNGRVKTCGSCSLHPSDSHCRSCEIANDLSESSHGTS